jgi:DNA-directed RNA polymerase subunit M/transcription elongation factor TFIIS
MGLWIKGCPKCGGDLYSDRDIMGYYRQCLQCGYTFYEQRRREVPSRVGPPTSDHAAQGDEGEGLGGPKSTFHKAA